MRTCIDLNSFYLPYLKLTLIPRNIFLECEYIGGMYTYSMMSALGGGGDTVYFIHFRALFLNHHQAFKLVNYNVG